MNGLGNGCGREVGLEMVGLVLNCRLERVVVDLDDDLSARVNMERLEGEVGLVLQL